MNFDWKDLAFGSAKKINVLDATFIAAPRELSEARFKQIVKEYLRGSNIVLGLAKEDYIDGFEGQPQFRTLQLKTIQPVIDQVNQADLPHKIYTLSYFQRELPYILQKLKARRVLFVRGSWHHTFHTRAEYYTLADRGITYDMISPFSDEAEARAYEEAMKYEFSSQLWPDDAHSYSEKGMLELAQKMARASYDYGFQTGAVLGERLNPKTRRYRFLTNGFNKVMPFQTYAMHYGATREENFTPPNDLSYYDTIHAEVKLILNAHAAQIDLQGKTVFINLMPCPTCSRMLAETGVAEVVYSIDHSNGYAVKMLEAAGKKVRRVVL